MLGWLKRKGENAKVYMCIKDLKMFVELAGPEKRARTLAGAGLVRGSLFRFGEMIDDGELVHDVMAKPLEQDRRKLMFFYEELERIRNVEVAHLWRAQAMNKELGLSEDDVTHRPDWNNLLMNIRGHEVWMATLGAGIVRGRIPDVRRIWERLAAATPHVRSIIEDVKKAERRWAENNMVLCGTSASVVDYSTDEWYSLCDYVPAQLA